MLDWWIFFRSHGWDKKNTLVLLSCVFLFCIHQLVFLLSLHASTFVVFVLCHQCFFSFKNLEAQSLYGLDLSLRNPWCSTVFSPSPDNWSVISFPGWVYARNRIPLDSLLWTKSALGRLQCHKFDSADFVSGFHYT